MNYPLAFSPRVHQMLEKAWALGYRVLLRRTALKEQTSVRGSLRAGATTFSITLCGGATSSAGQLWGIVDQP